LTSLPTTQPNPNPNPNPKSYPKALGYGELEFGELKFGKDTIDWALTVLIPSICTYNKPVSGYPTTIIYSHIT